jgi:hypothetical protein
LKVTSLSETHFPVYKFRSKRVGDHNKHDWWHSNHSIELRRLGITHILNVGESPLAGSRNRFTWDV